MSYCDRNFANLSRILLNVSEEMPGFDLIELRILFLLNTYCEPFLQSEIQERLGIAPSKCSRSITKLADSRFFKKMKNPLVTRSKDIDNPKSNLISITSYGRQVCRSLLTAPGGQIYGVCYLNISQSSELTPPEVSYDVKPILVNGDKSQFALGDSGAFVASFRVSTSSYEVEELAYEGSELVFQRSSLDAPSVYGLKECFYDLYRGSATKITLRNDEHCTPLSIGDRYSYMFYRPEDDYEIITFLSSGDRQEQFKDIYAGCITVGDTTLFDKGSKITLSISGASPSRTIESRFFPSGKEPVQLNFFAINFTQFMRH